SVFDILLKLPATDPHVLNEEVHRFLEREHQRLTERLDGPAPVVIALIARLVGNSDYQGARELLNLFSVGDRSPLAGVVAYLRYVTSRPPELSGCTQYRTLSAEDLFLGACYFKGNALPTLNQQSQWDYSSLERSLLDAANGEAHFLRLFKV